MSCFQYLPIAHCWHGKKLFIKLLKRTARFILYTTKCFFLSTRFLGDSKRFLEKRLSSLDTVHGNLFNLCYVENIQIPSSQGQSTQIHLSFPFSSVANSINNCITSTSFVALLSGNNIKEHQPLSALCFINRIGLLARNQKHRSSWH